MAEAIVESHHREAARFDLAPLTERVLGWLGGPRLLWVTLWLTFPLLGSLGIHRDPDFPGWTFIATFSYASLLGFWGTAKVARQVEAITPPSGS